MQADVEWHTHQLNDLVPSMINLSDEIQNLRRQIKVKEEVIIGLARNLDRTWKMLEGFERRLHEAEERLKQSGMADKENVNTVADSDIGESVAELYHPLIVYDVELLDERPAQPTAIANTSASTRTMIDKEVDATAPLEGSKKTYSDAGIMTCADELVGLAHHDPPTMPGPSSMPPPSSQPAVVLQPPTPQKSQEEAIQTTLLEVPAADIGLPDKSEESQSPVVGDSDVRRSLQNRSPSPLPSTEPRRSPRIRSVSPLLSAVPSKRPHDLTEDERRKGIGVVKCHRSYISCHLVVHIFCCFRHV